MMFVDLAIVWLVTKIGLAGALFGVLAYLAYTISLVRKTV
jgi:hypothetical protein